MKTMGVADFKAKCIAVLREAQRSGEPLFVTRRGSPLVRIEPISEEASERRLRLFRGRMRIRGDIGHASSEDDWNMRTIPATDARPTDGRERSLRGHNLGELLPI